MKRQVIRTKHPVPIHAKKYGFFYRLRKAKNAGTLRLVSRNQDPHTLELFITATSTKWICYKDEDTPLHCYECSQRQQRECTLWTLAKSHRYWTRLLRLKNTSSFLEHPLVRQSREVLVLLWLRLQRVYRIQRASVKLESEAMVNKRAKRGRR
ncbi:MAG: hypothetical protein ACXABY_06810 [Candidatus Thorarchaeota archaeon]|jgi:hypothetical protein